MPRLRFDQYLSILLIVMSFLLLPSWTVENQPSAATTPVLRQPKLITSLVIPMYQGEADREVATAQLTASMSAASVYVMDRQSGAVLYEKLSDSARYPASTAKLMTALMARKAYPLEKVFTVKEEAFTTGTVVSFNVGEELTVEQLLKALLIPSGNDAAFVLANNHPLGYQGFIAGMNALAKDLNLDHTEFGNPSGLDIEHQTSTARDIAILAHEVMKDDFLREVVGVKQTIISDVTGTTQHTAVNTNELLGVVPGVVGIKTGTTEFAGENLVTQINRNGQEVIIVLLGSQDRFRETRHIIDWVFKNYQWRELELASDEN